ncbi:MAG: tetratricopeptide repeat protein [Candidatus Omnitrophica bacterium]|nr:tetratricopeptide repeat protein [Candidatus Omnitrophota bacterium]
MKPEHKKYILENINKYSVKLIAKKLNIKYKKLKKEIKNLNIKPTESNKIAISPYLPTSINRKNRKIVSLLVLIIVVFTMLSYVNSLKNDFIWDDEYLILLNPQIKSFSHIKDVFKTYVGYGSGNVNNFYRPLQELSNMIDYFLWAEDPIGFHLTNVILHSLTAAVLFLFIFYITNNIFVSFFTGILFGVHPINTQAVTYIAGRADSLYSLFFLLALVLYVRFCNSVALSKKNVKLYLLSLLFFAFALLSKELSIILPLILLTYLYILLKGRITTRKFNFLVKTWLGYIILLIPYAVLRTNAVGSVKLAPSIFAKVPLFYRIITFFKTILIYLGLLFFPHGLHMERRIQVARTLNESFAFFAFLTVVAILFCGFWMLKKNRTVSFFIFWFFITLLPVSNIVPINSLIAEHWVYMAQVGFFVIIFLCLYNIYTKFLTTKLLKISGMALLCVVVFFYMFATIERNKDWKDEITFFKATLKYHPNNPKLHLNLGNTYSEKGMKDEALAEYNEALRLRKDNYIAYGNIGSIYIGKGNFVKAKENLTKAIDIKYDFPMAHYNLGRIYYHEGNLGKAKEELSLSLKFQPSLYIAHNLMGKVYIKENKKDVAKKHLESSLKIYPDQPEEARILRTLK